jgi:hypothetical protein
MSNGQHDGDASVRWQPGADRAFGPAPWHLWGNIQRIQTQVQSPTNPLTFASGQLLRIAYKRPETWHWVLSARLISGSDANAVDPIIVDVMFDVAIGVGRSMVQLPFTPAVAYAANDLNNDPPFERLRFVWGGPTVGIQTTFPRNAQLYSTAVLSNRQRLAGLPADPTTAIIVDQIVAENIQVNCRVQAVSLPGSPWIGTPVEIEVSGHFAPKTHVRPDWFQQTPGVSRFAGNEVGGQ